MGRKQQKGIIHCWESRWFPLFCAPSNIALEQQTYFRSSVFLGGWNYRLFIVLYFSVRSSRSSALCYGCHLAWVSKLLWGWGRFGRKREKYPPPPPRAIIPVARPLGTFKNQDTVTVRRGISKRSHEKIGDCEQSSETKAEKTGCSYRLQATEPSINFIISKSVYCSSLGNQCLSEMINKVSK